MKYNYRYKAHPTKYNGILFRSRLEAKWACFFDLCGWSWEYEPVDLEGWSPDFLIHLRCSKKEYYQVGEYLFNYDIVELLGEVKPYSSLSLFNGHKCVSMGENGYGTFISSRNDGLNIWHSNLALGLNPRVTKFLIPKWHVVPVSLLGVENWEEKWKKACNNTQWKPLK